MGFFLKPTVGGFCKIGRSGLKEREKRMLFVWAFSEGVGVGFVQLSFGLFLYELGFFLMLDVGSYKSFEGLGVGFVQLSFGLFLDVGWWII